MTPEPLRSAMGAEYEGAPGSEQRNAAFRKLIDAKKLADIAIIKAEGRDTGNLTRTSR